MRKILREQYLNIIGSVKKPTPGIHVINAHYVTPFFNDLNAEIIFENFLKHLSKNCEFVKIEDAAVRIKENDVETQKTLVAFSFDDGFEECYHIIAPALERYGTNAAFFINPNFVECDTDYYENLNKRTNTYGKKSMTWKQILDLKERGHIIGAHTMDHIDLGQQDLTDDQLNYQIVNCKNIIQEKLGNSCSMFAFPYGQLNNLSEKALRKTQKNYTFIFSGTNYKKYFSRGGMVINRRHLEPFWPNSHLNYFLSFQKKMNI